MKIADIKKYINKRIKECDEEYEHHDRQYGVCLDHRDVSNELEKVRDMLDELESKAKWEHDGSQYKYRFICSNCGHKIFEEQQPYCSNCGARMNDEVDDESKD